MRRKPNEPEWMLLAAAILFLLLLFAVKHCLDASFGAAGKKAGKAGSTEATNKETVNGEEKKSSQTERGEKVEAENAAFREQTEKNLTDAKQEGMFVRIRVLLTGCGTYGTYQEKVSFRGNAELLREDGSCFAKPQETVLLKKEGKEETIRVIPEEEEAGTALSFSDNGEEMVYPGNFTVYRTPKGLLIVNEVDLETYLRYVVPGEMPSGYEKEALKAQAVCARTYACARIREKTWEEFHADVDDSVESQVYHKIEAQPVTDEAVQETEGEIMTWKGEPIQAYFFSTSCGKTSTDEVWEDGTEEPYLKSVTVGEKEKELRTEEAFASFITGKENTSLEVEDGWYRWQVTLPADELTARAEKEKLGAVQEITVLRRSDGGAAEKVQITGTKGRMEISGEYKIRKFFSAKGYAVQKNDGTESSGMELLPSACFTVMPEQKEGRVMAFTFYGGGYGHGVGMSQNGAQHLARKGKTYRQILNYFYQNIEIQDCHTLS